MKEVAMSFVKTIIATDKAPLPLGTYSQAVKAGQIVYNAGVIGIDPLTSALVQGGCREQLTQIFKNLQALCTASGGSLEHCPKVHVLKLLRLCILIKK